MRLKRLICPDGDFFVRLLANGDMSLFESEADLHRFEQAFRVATESGGEMALAWCFLKDEVQLLLHSPAGDLSRCMQQLQTRFARELNRSRNRRGHVFRERYQSKLVDPDWVMQVARAVHLAPVRLRTWRNEPLEERRTALRSFSASSYRIYLGQLPGPRGFDPEPLLRRLPGSADRRAQLQRYTEAGLSEDESELLKQMEKQTGNLIGRPDDAVTLGALPAPRDPDRVEAAVLILCEISRPALLVHRNRHCRMLLAWAWQTWSRLTQTEIARRMGDRSPASVCLMLKAVRESGDTWLRKMQDQLRRQFES